jgi:hypothetical protein
MQCLLCEGTGGRIDHVFDDIWSCQCSQCGAYLFDEPFGTFVSDARLKNAPAVTRTLRAIRDYIRHAPDRAVATMALYDATAATIDDTWPPTQHRP